MVTRVWLYGSESGYDVEYVLFNFYSVCGYVFVYDASSYEYNMVCGIYAVFYRVFYAVFYAF